jgi:hypothetical protein
MADKVGDEPEGYVTGVAAFGQSSSCRALRRLLVHVPTMADDYYRSSRGAHAAR